MKPRGDIFISEMKRQEYVLHGDWGDLIKRKTSRNRKGVILEKLLSVNSVLSIAQNFIIYIFKSASMVGGSVFSSTSLFSVFRFSPLALRKFEMLSFPITPLDLRIFKGEILAMQSYFPGPISPLDRFLHVPILGEEIGKQIVATSDLCFSI